MKKILATLCLLVLVVSCKASTKSSTKGSRKITTIERSIVNYSELSLTGSVDLIYEQKSNEKPYLLIETDDNLQKYVIAEVKNGILQISLEGNNIQPSKFKAYTNSASLAKVKIAGSGDVTLKNKVESNSFEVSISGSGGFTAKNIQSRNLTISIEGSGNATVAGKATKSNITIKGSGDVDALNLSTQYTRCSIKGSGDAKVYSTEELVAKVSGSGDIRFKGSPKEIDKSVRGSGSITGM